MEMLCWAFLLSLLQEASNNKGLFYTNYVEQVPVFSISGGFFTSNVIVNIQDLYNKGIVRYTIDGFEPNEKSPQFGQALTLSKTTVKARMFYPNQIPGPIVTNTYFINEHFDQRKLPIISIYSSRIFLIEGQRPLCTKL